MKIGASTGKKGEVSTREEKIVMDLDLEIQDSMLGNNVIAKKENFCICCSK